ncbi:MAG: redoxin domain-containing protein [Archangiaceae bacterium]|nr:redoxin domain-containing protein [Archangiaceae bacterium]
MARRADLKTGYNCNSNCVFCVIGDKLFTGDRTTEDCIEELKLSRQTCEDVVFTGAEVTIRPDFFQLVAAAKALKYRNIQIQTNGRMFAYLPFCERAIQAGANEFSPSVHGHTAKLHDGLTRSQGSFNQIVQAIKNLKGLGQRIVVNSVAARQNVVHLPAMARLFVELKVDQFQIAFPHPTGHAETYFNAVVPKMSELAPYVHEAMRIGREGGVSCMAEAMPYCMMQGYERFVSELFIPPTEIVYDGFVVPDYKHDRMERGKTRFAQCATCRFEPMCEGPWREYPQHRGSDEFQPVAGPRVVDTSIVLDERFSMLGTEAPAFALPMAGGKRLALADLGTRWVAVAFYPEDGSPGCTAEACSIEAGLSKLAAAGISVVGISPDAPDRHAAFAQANRLTYPLLADVTGQVAEAWRSGRGRGFKRTTYLLGPQRRIDHILVEPDVQRHAAQILDAVTRFEAGPRTLERGEEQVIVRRPKAKPVAEAAAELGLSATDTTQFSD